MKVLGTNVFIYGDKLKKLEELGYKGSHHQFRIVCKCKSMADANRKCEELGLGTKVFASGWCCETGNETELSVCEENDVCVAINGTIGKEYVAVKDLV